MVLIITVFIFIMLLLAGCRLVDIQPGHIVCDPLCGSGAIPIQASRDSIYHKSTPGCHTHRWMGGGGGGGGREGGARMGVGKGGFME